MADIIDAASRCILISNLLTLSAKRNCWGTLIVPESGVNDVVNHAESMQESYELQCEANARMISE